MDLICRLTYEKMYDDIGHFCLQVHRKLCIPLPGLFQRGRMYKAQSCGSLEPQTPETLNPSKKGYANGVPLADCNRELNGTLVPLVCSVHLVDITECCRMC